MQNAMQQRRITSRDIVQQYLDRIAKYEDRLNAIITLNPRALEEADARDRERAQGKVRGPLHGIPIALKDNIHTTDMPTTGGALAFKGFVPPYEATITKNLREAGAIIIAKTNMTELANWVPPGCPAITTRWRVTGSTPTILGRPARGHQRWAARAHAGGSSSGTGTAANFWAANVGTETSGSILSPANQTMLVGIKPTVGRISRYGIIPITADQDTAGPMAQNRHRRGDFARRARGRRPGSQRSGDTGVPARAERRLHTLSRRARARWRTHRSASRHFVDESRHGQVVREAIARARQHGAVVVDPADMPDQPPPVCRDDTGIRGKDGNCSIVFKYGMKRDFNAWLASLGPALAGQDADRAARVEPRASRRRRNQIWSGAARQSPTRSISKLDRARYVADREKDVRLTGAEGIDAVMKRERLDALLFPGRLARLWRQSRVIRR